MEKAEQHIQSEDIRNAPILPKWNDICNADMNKLGERQSTDSLTQREYKKHGKFGVTIFCNRFSSWSNALAKAGLKNGKSRTRIIINDVELIADLQQVSFKFKNLEEVWIKLGRQPHFSDMK